MKRVKILTDYSERQINAMKSQKSEGLKIIVLTNCSIMTGSDGLYTVDTIPSTHNVRAILQHADVIISAIGHESTAKIMQSILCINVPVNRIKYEQLPGEMVIAFQLNDRPPEGKIITECEIEKIGYTWKRIEKYNRHPFQ